MVLEKIEEQPDRLVGEITIISVSLYIYTFIYIDDNRTLKWDTMCMKLYCSPESIGQFGPSADQAIVRHTYHHQMHWHRLQEFLGECIPRIHSNLLRQIKSFEAYDFLRNRVYYLSNNRIYLLSEFTVEPCAEK